MLRNLRLQTTEPPARAAASRLSGLRRGSCSWRDAVGPGYAVGVSERVVSYLAAGHRSDYCR